MVGNGAYEAGNISGGVLGLEAIFGNSNFILFDFNLNTYSFLTGLIAFAVLASGNYNILEKSLIFLVLLMSISFAITALISKPNIFDLFNGILIPKIPTQSTLIIIGLIGTTVVPYNLFLHAALSKEKWKKVRSKICQKRYNSIYHSWRNYFNVHCDFQFFIEHSRDYQCNRSCKRS